MTSDFDKDLPLTRDRMRLTRLLAVLAPARLEAVHDDPVIVIDTAHNPHGVAATLAGLREAFTARPLTP